MVEEGQYDRVGEQTLRSIVLLFLNRGFFTLHLDRILHSLPGITASFEGLTNLISEIGAGEAWHK